MQNDDWQTLFEAGRANEIAWGQLPRTEQIEFRDRLRSIVPSAQYGHGRTTVIENVKAAELPSGKVREMARTLDALEILLAADDDVFLRHRFYFGIAIETLAKHGFTSVNDEFRKIECKTCGTFEPAYGKSTLLRFFYAEDNGMYSPLWLAVHIAVSFETVIANAKAFEDCNPGYGVFQNVSALQASMAVGEFGHMLLNKLNLSEVFADNGETQTRAGWEAGEKSREAAYQAALPILDAIYTRLPQSGGKYHTAARKAAIAGYGTSADANASRWKKHRKRFLHEKSGCPPLPHR